MVDDTMSEEGLVPMDGAGGWGRRCSWSGEVCSNREKQWRGRGWQMQPRNERENVLLKGLKGARSRSGSLSNGVAKVEPFHQSQVVQMRSKLPLEMRSALPRVG